MRQKVSGYLYVLRGAFAGRKVSPVRARQEQMRTELIGRGWTGLALPSPVPGKRIAAYFLPEARGGAPGSTCQVVGVDTPLPIPFTIEGVDGRGDPRPLLDAETRAIDIEWVPGCPDAVVTIKSAELDELDTFLAEDHMVDLNLPGLRDQIPPGVAYAMYMSSGAFVDFVVGDHERHGVPSEGVVQKRLGRILREFKAHGLRNLGGNEFSFEFRNEAGGKKGWLRAGAGFHRGKPIVFLMDW